ncbi:MAG: response regulator [Firmicutes bacterium]|nr:response regulator [Bacillota bacterium]
MKGKKTSVLIIEDEWEYSDSLRDILEERGFSVSESTTGEEGLKKVKASEFDVALIDIKLPDMAGTQTLEKIRQFSPETIPIMMTAYASIDSAIDALERGAFAYLYKPVNIEELLIYIEKAREKKEILSSNKIQAEILNNINLPVFATSTEGRITFFNKRAAELFSGEGKEILGTDIKNLIVTGETEEFSAESLRNSNNHHKVRLNCFRGDKIESYLNISFVEAAGKHSPGIIWTFIPVNTIQ